MKILYSGITDDLLKELEAKQEAMQENIKNGLLDAAFQMRDEARRLFIANPEGYALNDLTAGILLGRLNTNGGGVSIALHAFGETASKGDAKYNTYKTRFFEGGTIRRQTSRKRNRGYIKSVGAIDQAVKQETLDKCLTKALKK